MSSLQFYSWTVKDCFALCLMIHVGILNNNIPVQLTLCITLTCWARIKTMLWSLHERSATTDNYLDVLLLLALSSDVVFVSYLRSWHLCFFLWSSWLVVCFCSYAPLLYNWIFVTEIKTQIIVHLCVRYLLSGHLGSG